MALLLYVTAVHLSCKNATFMSFWQTVSSNNFKDKTNDKKKKKKKKFRPPSQAIIISSYKE